MRALGIDYGERRIGLALSDATGLLASPWKQMTNDANVGAAARRLVDEIRALQAEDDGLAAIVIGLPRRLDGSPNEQTGRVRKLAELLGAEISAPITLQDERLTSHEADEILAQREPDWRRRKPQVDAMAAALILQDFLDHQPRPSQAPQASAGAPNAAAALGWPAGGESAKPTASAQRGGECQRGPTERRK